ncbi:membrane-bound PQQ-dependent dehydrogenase, glucose/quinate/shikimate family [Enterobacteriaceae bacterium BIT-l23]|uniref:membrane-bound PQQ-dependent dehydrogenase, glucose/quinate/shikimate family n=1 Tax=Jejubacter sp. L23 TaxID=3092086 RepID=UPI001584F000|nr:membrane-bound PQQ-dependent dehydrogenase, glucose/quinate/shikimate family [Enterobacteriaceae bacterium BIT-l23]
MNKKKSPGLSGKLFAIILIAFGLYMLIGGGWLIALGGNWYYSIAGVLSIGAGVQLFRGKSSAILWFGVLLVVSLIWTIIESGTWYWRWVPRFALMLVFAIIFSFFLPRLSSTFAGGRAKCISGVLIVLFFVAAGLAFAPHHVTEATQLPAVSEHDFSADTSDGPDGMTPSSDWYSYGGSQATQRYSSAQQISPENVSKLKVAWQVHAGDLPTSSRWGTENTPIKIGDFLYICTASNNIVALDPSTGKEKWRFDSQADKDAIPYTPACRTLAYFDDSKEGGSAHSSPALLCQRRVIMGTLDDRVIEVDADTGKRCTGFGNNGEVSILENMGETYKGYVAITSGPVIVRDTIVVGHQVVDGQRTFGPPGVVKAFDVRTGKLKWAWDAAAPYDPAPRFGDDAYKRGSPNVWTTFTGDDKLGLVYLPVANASGDYWSSSRTKEELEFSPSITALDIETGMPRWKFRTAYHDVWDYDAAASPTLVDYPGKDGKKIPALIVPTKNAEIYVLNRETGKPLFDVEERPAPQGGVEPEARAKVQPHSTFNSLRKPDLTPESTWGLTPLDQLYCRIQYHQANYDGAYTPPTSDKPIIDYPGYNGGVDWGGVAVDPQRGILVVNYNDMPNYTHLIPRETANKLGWRAMDSISASKDTLGHAEGASDPQEGVPYAVDVNAGWQMKFTGMLCKEPPYGWIRAVDLNTGHTLWDRPLGTARKNGPFGLPTGLPINIGTPNNGGSVVTRSGLIFIAAATDDLIRAIDIRTGKTLWSAPLPAGGQANPAIYRHNGKEYLIIEATGHHFMRTAKGDYVTAYALP